MALLGLGFPAWTGMLLLVAWLGTCAVCDLRTRTAPGLLTVVPLLAAAVARAAQGRWGAPALVAGLVLFSDLPRQFRAAAGLALGLGLVVMSPGTDAGVLVALVGIWILWEQSLAGGADAKIMMAVVLILWDGSVLFPIAIAGAVLAVAGVVRKRRTVPYIVAVAMGTLAYKLVFLLHPEGVIMKRLLSDSRGLESTEVALLIAAVVLVAYAAYQVLGQKIAQVVMEIAGKF